MGKQTTTSTNNQSGGVKELIDKHINNLDEKGKLQLPDELSDVEKELIRQAKRTRDAQSALSKLREEKIAIEAKAGVLEETVKKVLPADLGLSDDEQAELETLKYRDPDAYHIRMTELEKANAAKAEETVTGLTTEAIEKAKQSHIAQNRLAVLEEFRSANPDLQLTDDVLVNDVPPRFMNELNEGKYDYNTYLEKVAEYIKTGKVLPSKGSAEEKSLGDVTGGLTPGKKAAENAGKQDYKKMTF